MVACKSGRLRVRTVVLGRVLVFPAGTFGRAQTGFRIGVSGRVFGFMAVVRVSPAGDRGRGALAAHGGRRVVLDARIGWVDLAGWIWGFAGRLAWLLARLGVCTVAWGAVVAKLVLGRARFGLALHSCV